MDMVVERCCGLDVHTASASSRPKPPELIDN
jgi:hypothetical protein